MALFPSRPKLKEYPQAVWNELPDSSKNLSILSSVPIGSVRKILKQWQARGMVRRQTRFSRSGVYTWIYFKISTTEAIALLHKWIDRAQPNKGTKQNEKDIEKSGNVSEVD
jgi:predicted transcriptional regulator